MSVDTRASTGVMPLALGDHLPIVDPTAPPGRPSSSSVPSATIDSEAAGGVTVVVVTYESEEVIEGCLRSVPAALVGIDSWTLVVVDNASCDATVERARAAAPDATVLALDTNHGYAAAINAGIRVAPVDHDLLVLNPDVRVAPGAVAELRATLHQEGVGIAVPRIVDATGAVQPSLRRRPTAARAWGEAVLGGRVSARTAAFGETIAVGATYDHPADVDWATGAAFLVGRACLDDVGDLDESFFLYSEETDFMLRAGDAGHRVRSTPSATVVHLGGELGTSPPLWARRAINRDRLQRRRTGRLGTVAFLGGALAGEAVRAVAAPSATGRAVSRCAARELVRHGPACALGPEPPIEPARPGWICFSAQDWWYHNRAHSDIQLHARIADQRPVLLVNSIGLRMPLPGRSSETGRRLARKAASVARLVRRPDPDHPGLRVMTPLPLPFYSSPLTRRVGSWAVARQVTTAARAAGIIGQGRPDPIVVVTIPTAIDAARRIPSSAIVVNRSDKHSAFPESDGAAIAALEERALAAADLVVSSSHALLEEERPLTTAPSRLLDHGVDADHFRRRPSAEVPDDLANIAGPIVGFFGSLDDYLVDFDLIEHVAASLPEVAVVLIGDATCSMQRFEAHPNVHVLGFRPYATIPAYGSGFDVALMPWLDNPWIRYANPIKLKEYLALGLPIVSTDFPEVHHYAELVRIAADRAAFVAAVADTLDDGGLATAARRRAAVVDLTWDRAANQLLVDAERVADERDAARRAP
jgi:GT2 family glycosyltransferase/glycosyltransferase involved in cell wall biosynthesis